MSSKSEYRFWTLTPDQLLQVAEQVADQLGYKVRTPRMGMLEATQSFWSATKESFGFAWPAKVTLTAAPTDAGACATIAVSNFGLGPIQSGHVGKHLRRFLVALETAAGPSALTSPPQPRQEDQKYCSRCGRVIKIDSRFCPHCGADAKV